jgi:hypothetical protein
LKTKKKVGGVLLFAYLQLVVAATAVVAILVAVAVAILGS